MLLEEWKKELDSEARRKAARLDKENMHMKTALKKKQERIDRLEKDLCAAYNICHASNIFDTCRKCPEKQKCSAMRERDEKESKPA